MMFNIIHISYTKVCLETFRSQNIVDTCEGLKKFLHFLNTRLFDNKGINLVVNVLFILWQTNEKTFYNAIYLLFVVRKLFQ